MMKRPATTLPPPLPPTITRLRGRTARAALQRRVGQIALNVGKNIPAYRLPPTVAGEAMAFLKAHRWELARYALKSGDAAIAAQGALLLLSPKLFVGMYRRVMP